MRFSDMMGSGDEKSSKRSTPSESEALIADALAPYLDTRPSNAAAPEPAAVVVATPAEAPYEPVVRDVPKVADVAEARYVPVVPVAPPVVAVAAVAPMPPVERAPLVAVAPVVPVATVAVAPVVPVAPLEPAPVAPRDPIAATIADFAPISDDLLPRRR